MNKYLEFLFDLPSISVYIIKLILYKLKLYKFKEYTEKEEE